MKKLSVFTFAIAAAIGFSQLASAQAVQLQTQNAAAQEGVQTNGFGLSLGEPRVTSRSCIEGANNIYNTWLSNGATEDAAGGAYSEYYKNCMCAKSSSWCD